MAPGAADGVSYWFGNIEGRMTTADDGKVETITSEPRGATLVTALTDEQELKFYPLANGVRIEPAG